MPEPIETLVAGEYLLAVEGFALLRWCMTEPSKVRARVSEIRKILERYAQFPNDIEIPLARHGVEDGYTLWAARYDGPNPAIELEQPIVHDMISQFHPGDALDAACGTGRHAAKLVELGHRVIGVDATEAMLAVARPKVPQADLRIGRLERLPVDDSAVDLITCSLALTHIEDLGPVMREFARVLRPGGHAVLSDIHPFATIIGVAPAGIPNDDLSQGLSYVLNLTHPTSHYIRAFLDANLAIIECREAMVDQQTLQSFPSYRAFPEATRQAFLSTPFVLVWRLQKPVR